MRSVWCSCPVVTLSVVFNVRHPLKIALCVGNLFTEQLKHTCLEHERNTAKKSYLSVNVILNGTFGLCQRPFHLRMETKTVYQNYQKKGHGTVKAFLENRTVYSQYVKYTIYGLAVFLLVALTLVQSGQIVFKYFQEPTYISSHYDRQGSAVIPSISVCPELQEGQKANLKTDVLAPLGLEDLDSDQWKSYYIYKADEVFDSATFRTWELPSSIGIETVKEDPRTKSRQLIINREKIYPTLNTS